MAPDNSELINVTQLYQIPCSESLKSGMTSGLSICENRFG